MPERARRGKGRGAPSSSTCVGDKAGAVGEPEGICQLTEAGRGWPRLEAALSLLQRWRGVREGEPAEASGHSGRLSSTQLQHAAQAELQLSLAASLLPLDLAPAATCTFMGRAHAGLPALILSAPCVRAAGF